jgi:serine/threonine protein kinase
MTGIAHGLYSIHNFKATHPLSMDGPSKVGEHSDAKSSAEKEKELYGRHGDIKAENILWFKKIPGCENLMGVLQIADFGLGKFHGRDSRSKVSPDDVQSSPTYEPPECKLHKLISRAYDIWSLGCLYLEFITWLLMGSAEIDGFSSNDSFFTIINRSDAIVRKEVVAWVQQLHSHERCSALIHDLLDLIMQHVLIPDSKERISAEILSEKLKAFLGKAIKDKVYLLKSAPRRQKPGGYQLRSRSDFSAWKTNSKKDVSLLNQGKFGPSLMGNSKPPKDLVGRGVGTPAHPGHIKRSKTYAAYPSFGRVND